MKDLILFALFNVMVSGFGYAQHSSTDITQNEKIEALIDQYAQARENKDTVLLKSILTAEVDQLVSTGEWREGIRGSMQGMLNSSTSNPGERTLTVDKIRFFNTETAIADAEYEIKNADGSIRKMWSTFIVVSQAGAWKITAIRNMLPSGS